MKKKILAALLMLCMTGCTLSWLSTFEGYLKIAGPILIQILDIVSLAKGVAPNPAMVAKITADQTAVNQLAASISTAAAADLPTTCTAFNQAIATFAGDLTLIEQLANTGAGANAQIQAAVGIAQAAISEIEAPIAACSAAQSPAAAMAKLKAGAVTVTSPSDVVVKFNAVVDKKHRVHLHSKFARVATFGLLK
jgi:hypothetical protein